ncbi:MAG: chromosomal replication initiator protein DnaA [Treponemataceae bacterium]|nr:chromosomal replication initiator protein DnaA [Treponemataceae bacterium]
MEIIKEKWEEILELVREEHELTDISFDTWLRPLQLVKTENNTVFILVPSEQMAIKYLERKYALPLKVAIGEVTGIEYEIKFILPNQVTDDTINNEETQISHENEDINLRDNLTFDTFVVGNNNKFAHSVAVAVAESPGEFDSYNPLLIYGGPGLGKTHLMQAIAHYIKETNPSYIVRYVSSEVFTNELITALGKKTMSEFREKYRNVDVLLIDDIQFIIGKEQTQEEFFNTFNILHSSKKQIVISSDKPPKEMKNLEERISSRLVWGIMADISFPDYETRIAILNKKAELDNFHLSSDVLDYIATNFTSNIRDLEGALNKLKAFSNLQKEEITLEIAQRELENMISPNSKKEITVSYIVDVICDHFHISKDEIMSANRSNDVAYPHHV